MPHVHCNLPVYLIQIAKLSSCAEQILGQSTTDVLPVFNTTVTVISVLQYLSLSIIILFVADSGHISEGADDRT